MARLLRGLCSITLMTLFAACGGDGKKVVLCDGGGCTDAKLDVQPNRDVQAKLDVPDASPDRSPTPDQAADRPVETGAQPDTRPASDLPGDFAPRPDAAPPSQDTGTGVDQTQTLDVPITLDGSVDTLSPLDTGNNLDTGTFDTNQADSPPDVPADTRDAADVDTATLDTAGEAGGIDGGCTGVLCANFEDQALDGGLLPAGWTVVGNGDGWTLDTDATNQVLQQDTSSNTTSYIQAGSAWTDMTITLRVKLLSVANNDSVRICGRFTAANRDGYCLYIASAATGTAPGSLSLLVRQGGVETQLTGANASATGLDITVGTWHTYRLVISGAGPVTAAAYLDGATTATVSGTDGTAPYPASGHFGIGVRNATANFDDILITSP